MAVHANVLGAHQLSRFFVGKLRAASKHRYMLLYPHYVALARTGANSLGHTSLQP